MTSKTTAFAEIMESSLQTFVGQCWEWDKTPQFGSLSNYPEPKRTIFALVYQIQTGSMDPVRYPFPYKKTYEELLARAASNLRVFKDHPCLCIPGIPGKRQDRRSPPRWTGPRPRPTRSQSPSCPLHLAAPPPRHRRSA